MFLRNYYNYICRFNLNLTQAVSGEFGAGSLMIKNVNGQYVNNFLTSFMNNGYISLTDLPIQFDVIYTGIVFGTGNEPVTFNDYKLGTFITSGLNATKVSVSNITYDSTLNKFNCTSKHTLSNTTAEEIIIREYGIQIRRASNSDTVAFLIFRELLEPYALQPSESVNVVLNASYTMPTIDESGNVVAGSQAYGLVIE